MCFSSSFFLGSFDPQQNPELSVLRVEDHGINKEWITGFSPLWKITTSVLCTVHFSPAFIF